MWMERGCQQNDRTLLLGGKVRDRVRTYCGSLQPKTLAGSSPEAFAENIRAKKDLVIWTVLQHMALITSHHSREHQG